ncbi:MAG: HAMP domain-containing protein, partial [Angustibacter sp.]
MRSVRSRMAMVLAVVTFLPVAAAAAAIGWLAPQQANQGAKELMRQASWSFRQVVQQECYALSQIASSGAMQMEANDLNDMARTTLARTDASFVAVIRKGVIVGSAGKVPKASALELGSSSCAAETNPVAGVSGAPTLVEIVAANDADGYRLGTALAGTEMTPMWLAEQARGLGLPVGTEVMVRCPDGRFATTAAGALTRRLGEAARTRLGSQVVDGYQIEVREVGRTGGCRVATAVTRPGFGGQGGALGVVLLGGLIIGALLVLRLASGLTRPVLALTEAAERVARGDFSQRLSCSSDDELGRLSSSFNTMTDELERSIGELRRSRDLLRQNVARLGDTLERTHDLEGLLGTVLGAAGSATSARRGTAWLVEGGSVVARASVPAAAGRTAAKRLPLGLELPGQVAADGQPRRLGQRGRHVPQVSHAGQGIGNRQALRLAVQQDVVYGDSRRARQRYQHRLIV